MKFDRAEARRMRDEGDSYEKIGKALGVHHTTVYRALNPVAKKAWMEQRSERRKTRAEVLGAMRAGARRAKNERQAAIRQMAVDQNALVMARNKVARAAEALRLAMESVRAIEEHITKNGGIVDDYPYWCAACNSWVVPWQVGKLGPMCSKDDCRSGRVRPAVASEIEAARLALQRPLDPAQVREELEA